MLKIIKQKSIKTQNYRNFVGLKMLTCYFSFYFLSLTFVLPPIQYPTAVRMSINTWFFNVLRIGLHLVKQTCISHYWKIHLHYWSSLKMAPQPWLITKFLFISLNGVIFGTPWYGAIKCTVIFTITYSSCYIV